MKRNLALTLGGSLLLVSAFFLFFSRSVNAATTTYLEQLTDTDTFALASNINPFLLYKSPYTTPTGNFNAVTLRLRNDGSSTAHLTLLVNGQSTFQCSDLPNDASFHDVVFDLAVPAPINPTDFPSISLFQESTTDCHGSHVIVPTLTVKGIVPSVSGITFKSPSTTTQNFTPYFKITEERPITIASTDGFQLAFGSHTFSGVCPVNGTNRLALVTSQTLPNPFQSSDFTLTCTDYTWSASLDIRTVATTVAIVDKDFSTYTLSDGARPQLGDGVADGYAAWMDIIGYNSIYNYDLKVLYPDCDSVNACVNLKTSDDFPFRFSYRLDSNVHTVSDVHFILLNGCDSSFASCSAHDLGSVASLDTNNYGYVDVPNGSNYIQADDTYRYYIAELRLTDSSGELFFTVRFSTHEAANQDTAQAPSLPGNDLGFWGNIFKTLFVPRTQDLKNFTDDLPAILRSKIPFAYFYAISDHLTGLNATPSALTFDFPIHIGNVNVTMHLLDSSETNQKTVFDSFRSVLSWSLWIILLVYFYERVRHIEL